PEAAAPESVRRVTLAGPAGAQSALEVMVPLAAGEARTGRGALRVRVSTAELQSEFHRMRLALLEVALLAVGLGAVGSFFLARRIARPLAVLAAGTRRAAAGDLESRLELRTGDEMEELASAFNVMIGQIRVNQRAVDELNR